MPTYAMNLSNQAVSSRTDGATSSAEVGGVVYTASPTGLGRLLASAPVTFKLETGVKSWGTDQYLRPRHAYVQADGITDATISVELANNDVFDYSVSSSGKDIQRVDLGRGIKRNTLGVIMQNVGTSEFTLDKVELVGKTLTRKV